MHPNSHLTFAADIFHEPHEHIIRLTTTDSRGSLIGPNDRVRRRRASGQTTQRMSFNLSSLVNKIKCPNSFQIFRGIDSSFGTDAWATDMDTPQQSTIS